MAEPIIITRCRHAWPEPSGFTIDRPYGMREGTFLHFLNSVELLLQGQRLQAPAGSLIFFNPGTPQWFRSSTELVHNWLHTEGDLTDVLSQAGLQPDTLYLPPSDGFITDILREMEGEVLASRPYSQQILDLKFRELLIKISRACSGDAPPAVPSSVKETLFLNLRKQMFSNPERNWTVAELAELVHLSPSRFYDVYRALFHISPTADLIRARVDRAGRYLQDTDISVHTLAEQLGYGNVTHFCRQFKQLTGMTPSQYRAARNRI